VKRKADVRIHSQGTVCAQAAHNSKSSPNERLNWKKGGKIGERYIRGPEGKQKARVEREVECLKIVAPLLSEESEREAVPEESKPEAKAPVKRKMWP
jgi:hypothetical protein